MRIASPLTRAQIDRAVAIRARMYNWVRADRALDMLDEKIAGNDEHCALVKASAINAIYVTHVFNVLPLVDLIATKLKKPKLLPVDAVEAIAGPVGAGTKKRTFTSFASKYVHFFYSGRRAYIYDVHAVRIAALCVGREVDRHHRAQYKGRPYAAFAANIAYLLRESEIEADARELDRYLWLAGQLLVYEGLCSGSIGGYVGAFFKDRSKLTTADRDVLIPTALRNEALTHRRRRKAKR